MSIWHSVAESNSAYSFSTYFIIPFVLTPFIHRRRTLARASAQDMRGYELESEMCILDWFSGVFLAASLTKIFERDCCRVCACPTIVMRFRSLRSSTTN